MGRFMLRFGAAGIVGATFSIVGLASLAVAGWLALDLQADRAARDPIDLWTGSGFGILFGLGFFAIFGGIGLPLLALTLRRHAGERWARRAGFLVLTRFVEVARDTRIRVDGRAPYRIVSQWHNPRDRKVYRFESEPLWFDPAPYLEGRAQIGVKLDPERPRRYWMDTGFLPEVA